MIQIQDRIVAEFHRIERTGVGLHKSRSRGAVMRTARKDLLAIGFDDTAATQIMRQARDMWALENEADE